MDPTLIFYVGVVAAVTIVVLLLLGLYLASMFSGPRQEVHHYYFTSTPQESPRPGAFSRLLTVVLVTISIVALLQGVQLIA